MIGSKRKEERLRYLKNYWMERINEIPGAKFFTSFKPEYACGLGNFAIEGIDPADIQKDLFKKYKIYTITIKWENIDGIRVTPNLYTTTRNLDTFVNAVKSIVKDKMS
ncbi:hypothetical protein ES708_34189 [subsurface metagenome]